MSKRARLGLTSSRFVMPVSAGLVSTEVESRRRALRRSRPGRRDRHSECRGRGLARRVIPAALDRTRTMGPASVILFCHGDRVGLHQRLGFSQVRSPVSVRQPNGFADMPQHMMWYPPPPAGLMAYRDHDRPRPPVLIRSTQACFSAERTPSPDHDVPPAPLTSRPRSVPLIGLPRRCDHTRRLNQVAASGYTRTATAGALGERAACPC